MYTCGIRRKVLYFLSRVGLSLCGVRLGGAHIFPYRADGGTRLSFHNNLHRGRGFRPLNMNAQARASARTLFSIYINLQAREKKKCREKGDSPRIRHEVILDQAGDVGSCAGYFCLVCVLYAEALFFQGRWLCSKDSQVERAAISFLRNPSIVRQECGNLGPNGLTTRAIS